VKDRSRANLVRPAIAFLRCVVRWLRLAHRLRRCSELEVLLDDHTLRDIGVERHWRLGSGATRDGERRDPYREPRSFVP